MNTQTFSQHWDLTKIYPSDNSQKLVDDKNNLIKLIDDFCSKYKNKITSLNTEQFLQAIIDYENLSELSDKIACYGYLRFSENIQNLNNIKIFQELEEFLNNLNSKIIFFALEVNSIDNEKILQHLQNNKQLQKYEFYIQKIRTFKPYQLEENLEQILKEKSLTSTLATIRLYDETLAELRFNINNQELDLSATLNLLSSKDENIRLIAGQQLSTNLYNNKRIFTFIVNNIIKDKQIEDNWRNFPNPISNRNVSNLIEDDIVQNLIETVKNSYQNTSHKYYKIKAQLLNKKQLLWVDRNAPIYQHNEEYITWDKAKSIVLNTFYQFDEQFGKIAENFFINNYIDATPVAGKMSGAFSHPNVPSEHPYILLNYYGKILDVMTLAHELGHGIHQVLAAQQGTLLADTPLTFAETASIFSEMLTFKSLINDDKINQQQKNILLINKIEDNINSIIRQIAFCEFEILIHNLRKQGELSYQQISDTWLKTQQNSLGKYINLDETYKPIWSYISHFIHAPFYVYSYAFGGCLVNSLYNIYENQHINNFKQLYINLLKAGGSQSHQTLLQPFNLSLHDNNFWKQGITLLENMIAKLEHNILSDK